MEIYQNSLDAIRDHHQLSGGLSYDQDEDARPDSTAWAIIARSAFENDEQFCEEGRNYFGLCPMNTLSIWHMASWINRLVPCPLFINNLNTIEPGISIGSEQLSTHQETRQT